MHKKSLTPKCGAGALQGGAAHIRDGHARREACPSLCRTISLYLCHTNTHTHKNKNKPLTPNAKYWSSSHLIRDGHARREAHPSNPPHQARNLLFLFALVTGPRRSLSLKLSDTRVYEPQMRARLGNNNTPILDFYRNTKH